MNRGLVPGVLSLGLAGLVGCGSAAQPATASGSAQPEAAALTWNFDQEAAGSLPKGAQPFTGS